MRTLLTLLLEFAGPDFVLAQLLFELQILDVDNFFLLLHIVLVIYDIQAFLVLLVCSVKSFVGRVVK